MSGSHERRSEYTQYYVPEVRYDSVAPLLTDIHIHPKATSALLSFLGVSPDQLTSFVISGFLCVRKNKREHWRGMNYSKNISVSWLSYSRSKSQYIQFLEDLLKQDIKLTEGRYSDYNHMVYFYPDTILFDLMYTAAINREGGRYGKRAPYDMVLFLIKQQIQSKFPKVFAHECAHATQDFHPKSLGEYLSLDQYKKNRDKKAWSIAADPAVAALAKQAVELTFSIKDERLHDLFEMTCSVVRSHIR